MKADVECLSPFYNQFVEGFRVFMLLIIFIILFLSYSYDKEIIICLFDVSFAH